MPTLSHAGTTSPDGAPDAEAQAGSLVGHTSRPLRALMVTSHARDHVIAGSIRGRARKPTTGAWGLCPEQLSPELAGTWVLSLQRTLTVRRALS